jgi:hypothetical protein
MMPEPDATGGHVLAVPLVSQYQGLATDNVDCGPAAVAALLRFADPALLATPTPEFLTRIRRETGRAAGDTTLSQLAQALAGAGVPSTPLAPGDGRGLSLRLARPAECGDDIDQRRAAGIEAAADGRHELLRALDPQAERAEALRDQVVADRP